LRAKLFAVYGIERLPFALVQCALA
jgi:hypothetical protein